MSFLFSQVYAVELMDIVPEDAAYDRNASYRSRVHELCDEMVGVYYYVRELLQDACDDEDFQAGKCVAIVKCVLDEGGTMNYPMNYAALQARLSIE